MGTQGEPGLYKVVGDGREQSTIGAQQSQSMTQKANAAGIRLFDQLDGGPIALELIEASGTPHVVHLTYRVVR